MPSNTSLPAEQLLALADDLADASNYNDPIGLAMALEAYRAARASSPRTLEEALMDHLIVVEKSNDTEDRIAAMGAIITHGRTINARRLAGEGGA